MVTIGSDLSTEHSISNQKAMNAKLTARSSKWHQMPVNTNYFFFLILMHLGIHNPPNICTHIHKIHYYYITLFFHRRCQEE